jgi:hypothetical protein
MVNRYAYPWWKEKVIDSEQKRLDGLCPLTPEETVLFLQALGIKENTQIYIASGEIYGTRRMSPLYAAYPNTVSLLALGLQKIKVDNRLWQVHRETKLFPILFFILNRGTVNNVNAKHVYTCVLSSSLQ